MAGSKNPVDKRALKYWLLGASILAVMVLSVGGVQHRTFLEEARSRSDLAYENAAQEIIRRCAVLAASARTDCAEEAIAEARERARAEYDLYSQLVMALWTAIMGGMAVVAATLSGVGVYLIWQTWTESRRAADAAWAQSELARLQFKFTNEGQIRIASLMYCEGRSGFGSSPLHGHCVNDGRGWAHNIQLWARLYLHSGDNSPYWDTGEFRGVIDNAAAAPGDTVRIDLPIDSASLAAALRQRTLGDDDEVILHIRLSYETDFRERRTVEFTSRAWHLSLSSYESELLHNFGFDRFGERVQERREPI